MFGNTVQGTCNVRVHVNIVGGGLVGLACKVHLGVARLIFMRLSSFVP